ncbi:hypothetical protein RJ639_005789 [Escallonia herrerae]|uniref:AMP-dependent synthetase/ligase domain-containing protein n=1 Tax=Escallonia herrerae TaxID=1293975 RepID=A0AA88VXL4_9ASTE|nr:hypothetical protein RJ639_005789 [Escallonia herrerae]
MDPRTSIENQFSKRHPCFPTDTRIGIVGAGPSGLSVAYALTKLGYSNVTILEKHHSVGGMCESVEIEGRIYDLGGQVLTGNSAPTIFHLAKEIGAQTEELDTHKFAIIDSSTGKYNDMKVVDDYISVVPLTLKLQDEAWASCRNGVHAVSDIASDLAPAFLEARGFKSVPKSVAYGYTASGYGYVEDMPYAYIHEFTRTSMAGKIRRFKGGIKVDAKDDFGDMQVLEFDKIIITGSFPLASGKTYKSLSSATEEKGGRIMDMSELEKELFSKVETVDYYTTVLKIKGLKHIPMGFYYFGEFMDNSATIGQPVAMQKFYAETNIFLFWSYGNSTDIKGLKVTKHATDVVKSMGGEVEKVILQRRFKYFPHFKSQGMLVKSPSEVLKDNYGFYFQAFHLLVNTCNYNAVMKDGFYDKLEFQLQGQRNTYFLGGLMAFELTERNSCYAMALVWKHFANDSLPPSFPYTKRLFTLKPNCGPQITKRLDEAHGVEFPNLFPLMGLEFIDAFFGCLRARVIPVPAIPPDPWKSSGQALLHIENIAKTCNAVAILSTFGYHVSVSAFSAKNTLLLTGKGKCSPRWPNLPWLHTDSWIKKAKTGVHSADIADDSEPLANDLCFLQFTSGSTGDAKGVMITHGGVVHNVKLMRKRYNSTSRTVLVSWLPQYHDMGLIGGIFTSLVSGGSAVLFSPTTFIKNPLLWLKAMSEYHATHSAGPNFAFELTARRLESNMDKVLNLDLSSMVFLMVAAEPVRANTVKTFIELTRPFGLSEEVMAPCYGLAENCVFVSCAFGKGKPILLDWQGRVCCGDVDPNDPDVDVRIVDPETCTKHAESGKEGEIWISSSSAGIGYWGKEKLSQSTFKNAIQNDDLGKKYIRTGDLGRILDRKLFITGRIKDLIIISGRNIYPSDIEKTVESSSEFLRPGCCAVVGVPGEVLLEKGTAIAASSDQVGLVVIAEVR